MTLVPLPSGDYKLLTTESQRCMKVHQTHRNTDSHRYTKETLKLHWQGTKTLSKANLCLIWQAVNSQCALQRQPSARVPVFACVHVQIKPQQSPNTSIRATKVNAWTSWHANSHTYTYIYDKKWICLPRRLPFCSRRHRGA